MKANDFKSLLTNSTFAVQYEVQMSVSLLEATR